MKYNEMAQLKSLIMVALEKSVDEIFDQVQASEHQMAQSLINTNKLVIDLQPGYFDAALVLDFPKHYGDNGKGFSIFCNPVLSLKDLYQKTDAKNYSHKIMSEKLRNKKI